MFRYLLSLRQSQLGYFYTLYIFPAEKNPLEKLVIFVVFSKIIDTIIMLDSHFQTFSKEKTL